MRTPRLRTLATRGVQFKNAVCPSPLCARSRACLAAGLEYDRCGFLDNTMLFPAHLITYYRRLRDDGGYHVMGCGKFHVGRNINDDGAFCFGLNGCELLHEWGFSDGLFN